MIEKYKGFETDRLIIQPMGIEDVEFVLELLNTPKWLKYIGDRKVYTEQDALNYIKIKMLPQFRNYGYGNYLVKKKSDNKKLGSCGLYNREGIDGVDIGFAFLPEHEKQGYAFECTSKLLKLGIQEFKIEKIDAITTIENLDSQKLLNKLGLKFVKIIKLPNEDIKLMLYKL